MDNNSLKIKKRGDDGNRVISVRIKESTLAELDKIAAQSNYSRNELINLILSHGIKNIEIEQQKSVCFFQSLNHNFYKVITLKTRIRDLREDRDIKQTEIAKLLNVHQTTYSDYELGRLNLPIEALPILAKFYKTSIDYILYLTDNPTPYK